MTASPRLGPDNHNSRTGTGRRGGQVLLGEDWVSPESIPDEQRGARPLGGLVALNRSPLARKIVIFNLMALIILVAGVLFLNPFRDSLVLSREAGLVREARLISGVFEASQTGPATAPGQANPEGQAIPAALYDYSAALRRVDLAPGVVAFIFDAEGAILATRTGPESDLVARRPTVITDFLNSVWDGVSVVLSLGRTQLEGEDSATLARRLLPNAMAGQTASSTGLGPDGGKVFSVATPVAVGGEVRSVLVLSSAAGEIDRLVRYEREQVLQVFIVALLVSVGLSLVLASTIANPLSDLAAAAEIGRGGDGGKVSPGRVRIPDLAARPDEIGRLSVAMRGMVAALYDRIDANEQFAADVAHEIKNPLASLRSAVGSLRFVKKEEHREKLLDVIEHDVRRLDRLVSDISNASRLDSELVKEEEEEFDLVHTLTNLTQYLGEQAAEAEVDFLTDLPAGKIMIRGLEARLAQVFVNLITNAISFCEASDAVRVWARQRENRVLIVVEDTGPGIPEQALTKVFKRFYSDRPETHFGNNSGLGLSISKQIVEAHGGVIWAENIRHPNADPNSEPLGARFVVGLPV
ncbi:sensor histidine kinase [Rhodobacter sp. 24-YEA-8]|uniref:sensor histidine kinase n=1 Tax=Rhodobacter sp. 24-YEA-8 TaxID=1884310 RepID=UPI00089A7831|nr:sensor histidine kinase [Rhodobacter sp. 24-YEA-8]SEC36003.1 two-component system, OmpR family, sensor histidine kinase ChvG [Rhodobacter sp. 24-YEA-8]